VTVAGVVGCGVQARAAVLALAVVLPDLHEVRCYDAAPDRAADFGRRLQADLPGATFVSSGSPEAAAGEAGVVITAITMTADIRPSLGPGLLQPGALAVALDYDAAWSGAAMAECDRFFCDDVATVRATRAAGVRLAGIPGEIAGDLGELAAGLLPGRERDDERLFCLNLGMALEDVVTARLALRRAHELGAGRELPL
jgi:ornithine cyclodeaminase/alanine dehydrogenase-like protein (mu-crystallin family)